LVQSAIREFEPDAIYVHKMADLEVIEALVASGVPLVRMVHDHDIYCMRSYKYGYFSREICTREAGPHCVFSCLARNSEGPLPIKWVSYSQKQRELALNRRFDRMVVVTNYMKDELLKNGFESGRIEINAPVPRVGDASLRSTFSDRNLIIYAGQIIRGKGVDVLLESLALLETKFECVILGVMRYALPVVAFDAGGIKDWLIDGHNGFLVPWMDRVAYAARLRQLLEDKQLARQMGENGLQLVSQRYDFNRYIHELEVLFGQVIQEHQAARN